MCRYACGSEDGGGYMSQRWDDADLLLYYCKFLWHVLREGGWANVVTGACVYLYFEWVYSEFVG
jgi:hypothetical protein